MNIERAKARYWALPEGERRKVQAVVMCVPWNHETGALKTPDQLRRDQTKAFIGMLAPEDLQT